VGIGNAGETAAREMTGLSGCMRWRRKQDPIRLKGVVIRRGYFSWRI
jgi:hypothetical protein